MLVASTKMSLAKEKEELSEQFHYPEVRHHVDVEDLAQLLGRVLEEGLGGHDAGVVDEHGDRADLLLDLLRHGQHIFAARAITPKQGERTVNSISDS